MDYKKSLNNDRFLKEGLTFDDCLLVPAESDLIPNKIDVSTPLQKQYDLISL
jgi:IMP dehydrogenase